MTTAQAVAAIERIIVAAGQSDFSRETIANARAGLDALLSELQTMRQSKEHESERAQSLLHHKENFYLGTLEMNLIAEFESAEREARNAAILELEKRIAELEADYNEMSLQNEHIVKENGVNVERIAELERERDQLRAELGKIRVALRGYADSDLVSLAETIQTRLTAAELILATLCDMVLGEDAKDRSASALVRAVGLSFPNLKTI